VLVRYLLILEQLLFMFVQPLVKVDDVLDSLVLLTLQLVYVVKFFLVALSSILHDCRGVLSVGLARNNVWRAVKEHGVARKLLIVEETVLTLHRLELLRISTHQGSLGWVLCGLCLTDLLLCVG
jgi:hypothetical protein